MNLYSFNFLTTEKSDGTKNQQQTKPKQTSQESGNKSQVIIAESAKEIYLTGYKAATQNILKKLSKAYNISGAELQSLSGVIGVPEDVTIPNMMLVPPSSNKQTSSKHDTNSTSQPKSQEQQQERKNDDNYVEVDDNNNDNTGINPPPSTFPNNNFKHDTNREQNTDQLGPILLSCMVQDPVTSQYHSTLLPLNAILSVKDRPMSMPQLYKQSKLAMETVITQNKETNHKDLKRSISPKHNTQFLMNNNSSEEEFSQAMPLKRRYSDDRQVPVITGSRKRPPKLLHEEFRTNQSTLTPQFSVTNGGISAQQSKTYKEMKTPYDINTTLEMAAKELQAIYPPFFSRNYPTSRNHPKNDWLVEKESPLRENCW